jgi:hypothetical protein
MREASCGSTMPAIVNIFFIIYYLFSACSGSMHEASCSSMMPAIITLFFYFLFILYYLVPAAAACLRHPAAGLLFIYPLLLFMLELIPWRNVLGGRPPTVQGVTMQAIR